MDKMQIASVLYLVGFAVLTGMLIRNARLSPSRKMPEIVRNLILVVWTVELVALLIRFTPIGNP